MTSMHGSDSGWNRNYLKIIKNLSHTSKLPIIKFQTIIV